LQIIDFGVPTDDAANAMSLIGEVESTLQSMTR
jgi:hypothetical protein